MNKKLSMLLPVIATCGLLAGCGTDYYTKDSTVFVAKNGSVVSTDVEDFDTAAYKQDDLQSYVDKSIDDYNKKNDGSIKLKKLTVEKKKASLTMSYASTDEYTDFNGTKLFSGASADLSLQAGVFRRCSFTAAEFRSRSTSQSAPGITIQTSGWLTACCVERSSSTLSTTGRRRAGLPVKMQ